MSRIEDVILAHDRRGISRVRGELPADYCSVAAGILRGGLQRVFIVTGFIVAGRAETDGPPGALALARGVRRLGGEAWIVSDGHAAFVLSHLDQVIAFPMLDLAASRTAAQELLRRHQPTALISIERCGAGADGKYRNMRGEDISALTACLDPLFDRPGPPSIGIGDGGNEIGMGSLAEACKKHGVTDWPCVTAVDAPFIASVSNWGAWGLLAALSPDVIPTESEAFTDLESLVRLGCIDGITRKSEMTVDGWTVEENLRVLQELQRA